MPENDLSGCLKYLGGDSMLVNCTNHPYEIWNDPQRRAAEAYGEVVDFPFPQVDPSSTPEEIRKMVDQLADEIEALKPEAVLAAGEFTCLFMLVDRLLGDGVEVLCTCSKRIVKEEKKPDGSNEKKTHFFFEGFRRYEYYDIAGRSGKQPVEDDTPEKD